MNPVRLVIFGLILLCITAICPVQAQYAQDKPTLLAGNHLPACYTPVIGKELENLESILVRGTAYTDAGTLQAGDKVKDGLEVRTDKSSWCELSGIDGTTVRFWHGSQARVSWKRGIIHVDQGDVIVRIPRISGRKYTLSVAEGAVIVSGGTVRISKTRYGTRITSTEGGDLLKS